MGEPAKTIALLDDSRIVLDTLEAAFESMGYAVRTAETIRELDQILATVTPDLFVLDVEMPEAFGDEVAAVLRQVRHCKAPIVLFSGLNAAKLAERARDANVDCFVCKSDGVQPLMDAVSRLLRSTA